MNLLSLTLTLLLAVGAAAFQVFAPAQGKTSGTKSAYRQKYFQVTSSTVAAPFRAQTMSPVAAYRQNSNPFRQNSYLYNLEQGKIHWNGQKYSIEDAAKKMDEDLKNSQQAEAQAKARLSSLEQQISQVQTEQQQTAAAIQETAMKQQHDLEMFLRSGQPQFSEVIHIAGHDNVANGVEQYKQREDQLQEQIQHLTDMLELEKEAVRTNEEMTRRILSARTEIDKEYGELRQRYETDSVMWVGRFKTEKEAHTRDVYEAHLQLEKLKQKLEEMEAERSNLKSLFKQAFKLVVGKVRRLGKRD